MKLANAINTNRKFGKPRDLQCSPAPAQRSPFRNPMESRVGNGELASLMVNGGLGAGKVWPVPAAVGTGRSDLSFQEVSYVANCVNWTAL